MSADVFPCGGDVASLDKWIGAIVEGRIVSRAVGKLSANQATQALYLLYLPVSWNFRNPIQAGWLQCRFRVQPMSHGTADYRRAESVKGFELAAFGGHRRVNRRATRIQIRRDALLLRQRREREVELRQLGGPTDTRHFCAVGERVTSFDKPPRPKAVKQEATRDSLRLERQNLARAFAVKFGDPVFFQVGAQFSEEYVTRLEQRDGTATSSVFRRLRIRPEPESMSSSSR